MSQETNLHILGEVYSGMTFDSFRDGVRKRPAMYIGDVRQRGLHYMVDDIVASSLEEVGRGYARSITVALNADGSLMIADDGRGLPPVLDIALKTPWFPDPRAGGLGSVPPERDVFAIAVATALSEWLRLETKFEGRSFSQEYRTGLPIGQPLDLGDSDDAGISLTFMPDHEIFSDTRLCSTLLRDRLQECAMLHSGVGISFADEAVGANELFDFNDGTSFVPRQHETESTRRTENTWSVQISPLYSACRVSMWRMPECAKTARHAELRISVLATTSVTAVAENKSSIKPRTRSAPYPFPWAEGVMLRPNSACEQSGESHTPISPINRSLFRSAIANCRHAPGAWLVWRM